jgi:hypothetical protein
MTASFDMKGIPISDDAQLLLSVLQDCGLAQIWETPQLKVLSHYLKTTDETEDIRATLGSGVFSYFIKQAHPSKEFANPKPHEDVLFWLLRYADGTELTQALRSSLFVQAVSSPLEVQYNEQHPGYNRDKADFEKLAFLMQLEGFPSNLQLVEDYLVYRASWLEVLEARYGKAKILQKLRRSITSCQSGSIRRRRIPNKPLKGKTTGAKKFLELSSFDKVRLMRYYRYIVTEAT